MSNRDLVSNNPIPAKVLSCLPTDLYEIRLINGELVRLNRSTKLKENRINIEPGDWVCVYKEEIVYRWKDLKNTDQNNWVQLLAEIPKFIFESRGCHDFQASTYDDKVRADLNKDYIRENYFQILDGVIEFAQFEQGMKVLDIGIGTGLLTERMPLGLELYGIDISPKMMEKLREKNLSVKLAVGSFRDIPYSKLFFDRIISTFAFHHLTPEEKEDAFTEMDRVLKPGGYLVIGDFMLEDRDQRTTLIDRFQAEGRDDMLEEMEDEYFTMIADAKEFLESLGYTIDYQRGSTISWILRGKKLAKQPEV